jgi:DedD protein
MDRRVKERLVGASILVVLIVLIVPELLSGPASGPVAPRLPASAPEPVRNVTVDLATSKPPEPVVEPAPASNAPMQGLHGDTLSPASGSASAGGGANQGGAVSAAGAANPSAAAGTADAAGDARVPPPATAPPAAAPSAAPPSPAPLETGAPSPTSKTTTGKPATSGHGWAVQLGSFASRANADKLVRQLKAQGFGVYVLSGGSGAAARYRVRVGPLADRNAATQTAAKLKSSGHIGSLVAPSP